MLHCVLLDTSASMLRDGKLARAKGFLSALAAQCYCQRDHLAVIGFGGTQARWLHRPAKAHALHAEWIAPVTGGGATPVEAALQWLDGLLVSARRRQVRGRAGAGGGGQAACKVCVWLLTDARFVATPPRPSLADECVVVDFDCGPQALYRGRAVAVSWGACWVDGNAAAAI